MTLPVCQRVLGVEYRAPLAVLLLALVLSALVGCSAPAPAPVVERAQPRPDGLYEYTVRPGDTLFSIAWKHGLEYKRLAAANGIPEPYRIKAGQVLLLREAAAVAARPKPAKPASRPAAPSKGSGSKAAPAPASRPAVASGGALKWRWPIKGPASAGSAIRGAKRHQWIDITGKAGQTVRAAAPGVVVFAGNRLQGYGYLVVIKHSNDYMSAYGHNRKLLVEEGDSVKQGAAIAELGADERQKAKLHFEIRRQGRALNPLKLLPPKG